MKDIYYNNQILKFKEDQPSLELVEKDGIECFRIKNFDQMEPFFMTLVSQSDHWMFISSNGGLSSGRKDEQNALFPYYTDDKITNLAHQTGSLTVIRVKHNDHMVLWQPFSNQYAGAYRTERNLYKAKWGNRLTFEEINHDLGLNYSYTWSFSDRFGFVKQSVIKNLNEKTVEIEILDGLQNILPYGINSIMQNNRSNLINAYKRNELDRDSGLGIFALSAMIVDRAEPSEALKATTCFTLGITPANYLLSSRQVEKFKKGLPIACEYDVKGEAGAYLIQNLLSLNAFELKEWLFVSEINQSHASINSLISDLNGNPVSLQSNILNNIEEGFRSLKAKVAKSDGLQLSNDPMMVGRHYSNVLFNIMRGGIFEDDYLIDKNDLVEYLVTHNKYIFQKHRSIFSDKPEYTYHQIIQLANESGDPDLIRLCTEYLPLSFSRRHGDPSRPWNKFSINLKKENGEKERFYQGNWRDIFQNWEALGLAFPGYLRGMIYKFLNASTADGYNPYRITRNGIDWEEIEPEDPWSYIGYWGDHQIIYLLKLLEFIKKHKADTLINDLNAELFVFANVPYRIKSYQEIAQDPKDTIHFDHQLSNVIRQHANANGADARLLLSDHENTIPLKASLLEKLLISWLTKIYNFIPGAGIWLNTQRPEWNDANNSLVGNGCSMVTLYYLRRYTSFLQETLQDSTDMEYSIHQPVADLFHSIGELLHKNVDLLSKGFSGQELKKIVDNLGKAGETYRDYVYQNHFGVKAILSKHELEEFIKVLLKYIDHSILENKRTDGLYHAYNLIEFKGDSIDISYLYEMLEGQVAVLSSGLLSPKESVDVLEALKKSAIYREDQYSYLLYPNRELPGFLSKNKLDRERIYINNFLSDLIKSGNHTLIEQDSSGNCYFNGNIHNARDIEQILARLQDQGIIVSDYDRQHIFEIFEEEFDHKSFTGRSGTFFGYEGLGSIYWHMVSKLLLAVQENLVKATEEGASAEITGKLTEFYYEIRAGIGINKSPDLYGAFPTDPYSHTPFHKGAQQPGMTGQVKEDILNRWAELGVKVNKGKIAFNPTFLHDEEFLSKPGVFEYFDGNNEWKQLELNTNELAFTYCQIPIIYRKTQHKGIIIHYKDGQQRTMEDACILDEETSKGLFDRTYEIEKIIVQLCE